MEETLLLILKNELYITWSDEESTRRLERIILNAIQTMNFKIGYNEIDYSEAGIEQNLFINYCVYVYNGCANEFDEAYFNELMQVRQKYEVQNYEDE